MPKVGPVSRSAMAKIGFMLNCFIKTVTAQYTYFIIIFVILQRFTGEVENRPWNNALTEEMADFKVGS